MLKCPLKAILITFLFILLTKGGLGQFRMTIHVRSAVDGQSVLNAHVSLFPVDSKKGVHGTTGNDGKARIELPDSLRSRQKILYVSHVSFRTFTDTLEHETRKTVFLEPGKDLQEIVITGSYGPEKEEGSIHEVQRISGDEIKERGANNLGEALEFEPGVRLNRDAVLGSGIEMQGLSGQNVKILIDGVPVIGRMNGNIDPSQLDMDNIERIEVIRGPLSVQYGTNALAGTINIITKKEQREDIRVQWKNEYETVGRYNSAISAGFSKGDWNADLMAGRDYFDGWSAYDPFFSPVGPRKADSTRDDSWMPKEQKKASFSLRTKLGNLRLRSFNRYLDELIINRGRPRLPYMETAYDEHYRTFRLTNGLSLKGKAGDRNHLDINLSRNFYRRNRSRYFRDLTTLSARSVNGESVQGTNLFEQYMFRGTWMRNTANDDIQYRLGADLKRMKGEGGKIPDTKYMEDLGFFGSFRYQRVDHFIFKPALRYTYNSRYDAPLIPSLHARFLKDEWTLRASYGRGFRAPDLKELFMEFIDMNHNIVGNPELQAERSNNYQFSVEHARNKEGIRWNEELQFFYNDIRDRIELTQTGPQNRFTYVNLSRFRTLGVNAGVALGKERWKMEVEGSLIGRSPTIGEEAPSEFLYSPDGKFSITYFWEGTDLRIRTDYKYTGAQPGYVTDTEGTVRQVRREDYHMLDVNLARSFWNDRLELGLSGRNLLDVKNVQSSVSQGGAHTSGGMRQVAWGRSIYMKATLKFSKDEVW